MRGFFNVLMPIDLILISNILVKHSGCKMIGFLCLNGVCVCVCVYECLCSGKDLGRRELICGRVVVEKRNTFWLITPLWFTQVYFCFLGGEGTFCTLTCYLSTRILQVEKCSF